MNDVCSIELLTKAVANRLSADEEAALYDHLERCEACCARMEQLAGGEQWQQEAAALLTTDELDAAVPEPMGWSEVDFSVEHLEPSDDASVLGQLGGYDVLAIVGRGGMGVVLKAFDRELKRFVAIKALSPHLAHSSVARKRFAREAQAAAAVVNPHVIAIHHVQPTGRLPFLIMPLLTGESLAQRLKSRAPLELTEVLRIGMQAAVGLAAAHDQGLVHRDVKPANIFLEKGVERVVITDFGLARAADDVSMTRLGIVAGTPEYMSPQQARGEALDGRSDLFSLGCVLYEMATGVSPFRSDSTIATLRRIVDDKPAAIASLAPELPPWFGHIVERLLSKDPAQRFASASEVSQLLEQCLSHLQQPTSVPLPASLVAHANGRRSFFDSTRKGMLALLGTVGMTLLGMVLWQATEKHDSSGWRINDVGADGRILTKLSELHGNLSCRVSDGAKYAATIIKSSKDNDLALIKIEPKAPLTSLSLDTSILERFAHIAAVLPTGKRPWNRGMSPMDDSPIIGIVTEAAQRIAPIAGSLGLFSDDPNGVRLTGRVVRTVGLELNDVVQSINGKPTPNLKAFEKVMHPIPESVIGYAGDKVSVRFVRGEKTLEKECVLAENPRESLCEESPRRSGFTRAYDSDLEIYQAECGAPVLDADGKWIGIAIATRGTGYVYVLRSSAIQAFLAPSK